MKTPGIRRIIDSIGLDGLIASLSRYELNTIGVYAFGGARGGAPDGDGSGDSGGGDDGGVGSDGDDGGDKGDPAPRDDPEKKRLAAKVAKMEKAEKDRAEREKKAADEKRIEEEGAKKLLEERDAETRALREKLDALEQREKDRIEARVQKLPEASRTKLELVREKLDLESFAALVDAESESIAKTDTGGKNDEDKNRLPPGGGGTLNKDTGNNTLHNPSSQAIDFLRDDGHEGAIQAVKHVKFTHNDAKEKSKMTFPTSHDFIKSIKDRTVPPGLLVPKK